MDSEEQGHVKEMLRMYKRRLWALELKKAQQGLNAPVDILMEIEDLGENILRCQSQIDAFHSNYQTVPGLNQIQATNLTDISRKQIEITFNGSFDDLTAEIQSALVRAIAGIVEISPDQVTVLKVMAGSVIFSIELPSDAADALLKLYASGDEIIKELGIQNIKLTSERVLALPTLVKYAIAENTELYKKHESEPAFAYELFRRALVEQDKLALEAIENIYKDLVRSWIEQRTFQMQLSKKEIENLVYETFDLFKRTISPSKFGRFSSFRALLAYLKMSVHPTIVDYGRQLGQTNSLAPALAELEASDALAKEEVYVETLWPLVDRFLQDDKERLVMHSTLVAGLKPREIYEQNPKLFASIDEVYRIKQNILARLRRSPEFRELFD
jgi:hypothetical protein